MRQPTSLEDAKAIFREEKAKITGSLSALAGSRWLTAILATLVIAFGVNLIYSPTQLPTFASISVASVGLPQGLDFGVAAEQAAQIREAAREQELAQRGLSWAEANPDKIPLVNAIGAGGALLFLLGNMWVMTKRRRVSRG